MSRPLLYLIVFIEGFCSLGAEVIALRRLLPHMGSSIVITAPTIGLFLLALALGYASGSRVDQHYRQVVGRNFLLSALLIGLGMSRTVVEPWFGHMQPIELAYLGYVGGVLCPVAWLLGQTVPVLTNLMQHERTGRSSGLALYASTLGSFAGSLSLSLLVMQWWGVSAAVLACTALLLLGHLLLGSLTTRTLALNAGVLTGVCVVALLPATSERVVHETAYADYEVRALELPGLKQPKGLMVNQSLASLVDASDPPHYTRYVSRLRQILLQELQLDQQDILVLGAGGFTVSQNEPLNRYTYVDVDPAIHALAEREFLHAPINGRFIADDARHFVRSTAQRYAAVVVDVFSSHTSIPGHLVTQAFWADTRRALLPHGTLLINTILDPALQTPYARNLLATIESVYGRCGVEVLHRQRQLSNVLVICHAQGQAALATPYLDEHNSADLDMARSGLRPQ